MIITYLCKEGSCWPVNVYSRMVAAPAHSLDNNEADVGTFPQALEAAEADMVP